MKCTVVVPCYNEAARFPVEAFRAFLQQSPDVFFILVNDGSKDATLATLEKLRGQFPDRVTVIDKKINAGKSEAVRDGIIQALQSPTQSVAFWDADLATPLNAIPDLLDALNATPGIQMVIGSRVKLLGRDIERKTSRHYLGRIFATVVSVLLRLPVYDTQCGAKVFRANPETERLFAEPFISRWVFDVEILARFIRARNGDISSVRTSIHEFPLMVWHDIDGSKVRPKDFARAFFDLMKIHRKYNLR